MTQDGIDSAGTVGIVDGGIPDDDVDVDDVRSKVIGLILFESWPICTPAPCSPTPPIERVPFGELKLISTGFPCTLGTLGTLVLVLPALPAVTIAAAAAATVI